MAGGLNLLGNVVPGVSSENDLASAIAKIGAGGSTTGATPTVGAAGLGGLNMGGMAGGGFGLNIPTANLALGGVSTLANLFMGMQALGQAKDQFNFTRRTTQANLDNQTKSYNTNMEDKLTARAAYNGQGREYVDDYMNKNRLSTPKL